jgi:hypothetical protein
MASNRLIILKYSDVLGDGTRSPKNYFEQLKRCASDSSLNTFSTLNNQFSLDPSGRAAHLKGETELLSDSIRNKIARLRSRELRDEEAVVFTRAGALLNLKLLLCADRRIMSFRPQAVGACAMHANDYIESDDPGRLASGLLPIVAEFAATWEMTNVREVGPLLRRCYYMYDVLLREDERISSLFKRENKPPPSETDFAGLPFRSYFPLLFGIYAVASSSVVEHLTSVVDAAKIAKVVGLTEQQFETFVLSKAWLPAEAARAFGNIDTAQSFEQRVCDITWCSDLRLFRDRPLLRLPNGQLQVLDIQFLIENASAGLQWHLRRCLSAHAGDIFAGLWGGLFERYVLQILTHYHRDCARTSIAYTSGEIDAAVYEEDGSLLVFEVKAGFLPEAAKASRSETQIAAALARNFIRSEKGAPKGVTQLAQAASALLAGEVSGFKSPPRVYPILVVEDPVMQAIAVNAYLDDQFRQLVGDAQSVAPLTVITIDELEAVLPVVTSGTLSWREILNERFINGKTATVSVNSTMHDIAIKRRLGTYPDTFLSTHSDRLWALIDDAYRESA